MVKDVGYKNTKDSRISVEGSALWTEPYTPEQRQTEIRAHEATVPLLVLHSCWMLVL